GVRDNDLLAGLRRDGETDMDDAIAVLGRVPERAERVAEGSSGTAMETDAFDPSDLSFTGEVAWEDGERDQAADDEREGADPAQPASASPETEPLDLADLQRSTSSSSDHTSSPRSTSSSDT